MTNAALIEIHKCISAGGHILFVSTKKQAADTISTLAKDTSQYFVNYRWLGGMLTNWKTISNSIKRYKKLTEELSQENKGFTKKEILQLGRERDKLERSLGGIADMKKIPDMMFVIDVNVESLAIKEALKLNIPIVAVIDTNSDPTGINFPIPGNDDARRAINLYCDLIKHTILDAQKNITKTSNESIKPQEKKEDTGKKIKADKENEKTISKTKKTKSIFSKVKAFTSKKSK
jgi:small subunit ribosomal protein S2